MSPADTATSAPDGADPRLRTIARIALGAFLAFAGVSHLTWSRTEFQAQVPTWVPIDADAVVIGSGLVEIALGSALIAARRPQRALVGGAAGAFFVAVFPGNISQLLKHADAFGLDTDRKRVVRLFFQPLLVLWALFAGGVV
jgi:uncharacterized membrane protein